MKNKYLAFAKNAAIATTAGLAAGAGVAELTSLISDSHTAQAVASTISGSVVSYGTFLPLHARDNRDIYSKDGKFNWKSFIWDQVKMSGVYSVVDVAFLTGRPFVVKAFLDSGIEPGKSSLFTDFILYPALFAVSFPIAKLTGNIRNADSELEKISTQKQTL